MVTSQQRGENNRETLVPVRSHADRVRCFRKCSDLQCLLHWTLQLQDIRSNEYEAGTLPIETRDINVSSWDYVSKVILGSNLRARFVQGRVELQTRIRQGVCTESTRSKLANSFQLI